MSTGGGDDGLMDLFREEAVIHLAAMTDGLVAVESAAERRPVLNDLMRAAHSLKGAARIVGLDPLVKLAHLVEDLFVASLRDEFVVDAPVIDVLLAIVDFLSAVSADNEVYLARIGEVPQFLERLTALRNGEKTQPKEAAAPAPTVGDTATSPAAADAGNAASAAAGAAAKPAGGPSRSVRMTTESLERLTSLAAESVVESERLEILVDDARDLHDAQRELQSVLFALREGLVSGGSSDVDVAAARAGVEAALATFSNMQQRRTTRETALEEYARRSASLARKLSRESVSSRMMPFESSLRGFPRLVRDVCRELGKRCRLEIRGESTLIDREVLEQLDAPLNHLVRNALDHGLEMPDVREAAGKPAEGRLEIEAFHRAGRLQVVVRDDGRGINPESLRRSIVERGLESQENASRLSAAELYEFLFLPGFSTAKQVTELSGRGVGLDAVRTQVQGAGGAVTIRSTVGAGTSFNLELPVTRSVTRALVVLIAGERYALPIANVERALVVESDALESVEGRRYFLHDGASVALVPAAEILDLPEPPAQPGAALRVLLLIEGERRYGLMVDSFEGERSFVVRRLDPRFGEVPDVAAISTDERGGVVLILDVAELLRSMDALITGGRLLRIGDLPSEAAVRRKRILVVDDSLTVRQAEKQMLENQGYAVDVAVDGVEGWSAVRLAPYDLVVSDVDMPRMNGIELVRRIRADQRLQQLPVVIVSYKDREEDRMRGLEAGATHYLAKAGFQDSTLITVVKDLIGEALNA